MTIDYANGKVYCIRNSKDIDKMVYIGSTCQPLSARMAQHRKGIVHYPNSKIYKLMGEVGIEHFHIELLADFPCQRRDQLEAEEGRYMRLYKMLDEGCNMQIAGQTREDILYWREKNKGKHSATNKAWYEANKAAICAQVRAYRDANKEECAARDKKKYESNKVMIAARSKKHYEETKEVSIARVKAYREANKEACAARCKAYREANKVEIAAQKKAYQERKKAERLAAIALPEEPIGAA